MNTNKVIFESGATSHAVNDLILFIENTKELAELRDFIYSEWANANGVPFIPSATDTTKSRFDRLFYEAVEAYRKVFPKSHTHIITMNTNEMEEFAILYAWGFTDWKLENGYK